MFVTVRGVAVHYTESRPAVKGEPWLLLIHGFGASLESWYDVVPLLAPSIRVVRVDLRGFGLTDKPRDGRYSLDEQAEIVAGILPRLGDGQVVIAGHSYGGTVTFLTYLKLRARGLQSTVRGLIFLDAATYPQPLPFFVANVRNPVTRFIAEHFTSPRWRVRFVLDRIFASSSRVDDARIERYSRFLELEGAESALAAVARQVVPDNASALSDSLRFITVPTLIIWGENDPVIPLSNGRRLHSEIQGSEFVVIPHCGHVPHEEDPETTVGAIRGFLRRL